MVTRYSGSGTNPISSFRENDEAIKNRRLKQASSQQVDKPQLGAYEQKFRNMGTNNVVPEAQPTAQPVNRNVQPQRIQQLIGKNSGMGWKSRLALNKEILSNRGQMATVKQAGLNQRANTMLTNKKDLGITSMNNFTSLQKEGMGNRNSVEVQKLSNAGDNEVMDKRVALGESTLAADVAEEETRQYNKFMADKTGMDTAGNPGMDSEDADAEYKYQQDLQKSGPDVANRNKLNDEVVRAEKLFKTFSPEQRLNYILSMSPEAQQYYQQDIDAGTIEQEQETQSRRKGVTAGNLFNKMFGN